jgi:sec-independent protein translocase protein TatA
MGMPSGMELIIIVAILLLLFGGKKIPELAKGLGKGIKDFKGAIKEDEQEATMTTNEKKLEDEKKAAQTTDSQATDTQTTQANSTESTTETNTKQA